MQHQLKSVHRRKGLGSLHFLVQAAASQPGLDIKFKFKKKLKLINKLNN